MNKEHFLVATLADFAPVIKYVLQQAAQVATTTSVVTLTGDLGAGKTAFTQELAEHLGVTETVVSPTFGIMKGYEIDGHPQFDQLIHIDAYRIEDISEVGPLRLVEVFKQPRTLVCIEWPARIAAILPPKKIDVSIVIKENEVRMVQVTK